MKNHHARKQIVLMGNGRTGKSTLLTWLKENQYVPDLESTVNANFYRYSFLVNNENYSVDLVDTAGQQKYHAILPVYYRDARGAIIMMDLSYYPSFQKAIELFNQLQEYSFISKDCICVVGNKTDLKRQIDYDFIREYWQEKSIEYMEISLKQDKNIKSVLEKLLQNLILKQQVREKQKRPQLRLEVEKKQRNGKCC